MRLLLTNDVGKACLTNPLHADQRGQSVMIQRLSAVGERDRWAAKVIC